MLKKQNIFRITIVVLIMLMNQVMYAKALDIKAISDKIVKDVGSVGMVYTDGKNGIVFVFEEYHTSRLGRLQSAVMLNRLYRDYNLKIIGLEGAFQSPRPISGEWFHNLGGDKANSVRENIVVKMVAEGEINSAELMELVYLDVDVYGTELEADYAVKLEIESNPQVMYLIAIAQKYPFSQKQIKEINTLIQQEKTTEAIEYMLNTDPWTRKQYEALKDTSSVSLEKMLKQVDEIQQKAREVNAQVDPKIEEDMEKVRKFAEAGSRRSHTMVQYVVETLLPKASKQPVAMIIGAAHTQEVMDDLKAHNVSCVQITPLDLNPDYGSLSMEQFELKNQRKWAQTDSGMLGGLLNGLRNPPPIIETASAQSYASARFASIVLAEFVSSGGSLPLPDDLKAQLESLQQHEMRIDLDSIIFDGNDVIYRMWLKNTANEEVEVWARVGIPDTSIQDSQSLEEKLLREISEIEKTREQDDKQDDKQDDSSGEGELALIDLDHKAKAIYSGKQETVVNHSSIGG